MRPPAHRSHRQNEPKDRLTALKKLRQSIGDYQKAMELSIRTEAGKPAWEAKADIDSAIRYLDWVSENGDKIFEHLLAPAKLGRAVGNFKLLPLGLTAGYLPFSTPVTSFVHFFAASVLAGCPLIITSGSHAVLSATLFAHLDRTLDLPPGMLNILYGNFDVFKQVIADNRVAAVLYVGSREHCDFIRREGKARVGRQHVLQSGGKNAIIVHSTADLDRAVRMAVIGSTKASGQLCSSTSRIFVHQPLLNELGDKLTTVMQKLKIGRTDIDVGGEEIFLGPLYSRKAVDKFLRFQTMAARESSDNLMWGKSLDICEDGSFVQPGIHVMKEFDNNSAYQGNVLFTPDLALYPFDRIEAAIEMCNTTDASLAVSFIGDPDVIEKRRYLLLAPNILVNRPTVEIEATLPLAGRLQSGHHRYHSAGIALYLCYPQVLQDETTSDPFTRDWPWPHQD